MDTACQYPVRFIRSDAPEGAAGVFSVRPPRRIVADRTPAGRPAGERRYYDRTGLLCPSLRNGGGHRLYTGDDARRLYQIAALRGLKSPAGADPRALDHG
ncbi:MerR family transcriptional regulator [Frankia gtarii]|uniref:MerR family transcriptional regulator n=1 Tax=Frankia gtarii TaxID=2950102 RepID=UPI0034D55D10